MSSPGPAAIDLARVHPEAVRPTAPVPRQAVRGQAVARGARGADPRGAEKQVAPRGTAAEQGDRYLEPAGLSTVLSSSSIGCLTTQSPDREFDAYLF